MSPSPPDSRTLPPTSLPRPAALGIAWEIGVESGWGTYGLNLALQAARKGVFPEMYFVSPRLALDPLRQTLLQPALKQGQFLRRLWETQNSQLDGRGPVLHALGDGLLFPEFSQGIHGKPTVGLVFFESGTLPTAAVAKAKNVPLIIAGSTWNLNVMRAAGLENTALCLQGIDRSLFHPAPCAKLFPDRFVVFSGGKLEYRKGQDLVIAAFRAFQQKYPEALLLTAWANLWPAGMNSLAQSPHTTGVPAVRADRSLDLEPWLIANGLPPGSFIDLGAMPNHHVPHVLRQADVALFPNRCEGGTNLVAMEAMACGVPVILSNNTGHQDLISRIDGTETCWPLNIQLPLGELTGRAEFNDWGEALIDEAVAALESAYHDHQQRRERGAAAARFMESWDWSDRVDELFALLAPLSP